MPFSLFNTSRKDRKAGAFSWANATAQEPAPEPAESGATVAPAHARKDATALAAVAAVPIYRPAARTDPPAAWIVAPAAGTGAPPDGTVAPAAGTVAPPDGTVAPAARTDAPPTAVDKPDIPAPEITRPAVAACLKYVIDPEVGINIVDLGLVYDLRVEMPSISLTLTMTTPACPMSGHIRRQVYAVLERIRGVEDVEVDLVWEPAWTPQMMDRNVGRRHFGGH